MSAHHQPDSFKSIDVVGAQVDIGEEQTQGAGA